MPTAEQRIAFPVILAEAVRKTGISHTRLGEKIGRTGSTVSQYLAGKLAPPPDMCTALEQALGLEPDELAQHLGYAPPGGGERTVTPEEAIMRADWIHPRVKQSLMAILEAERRASSDGDV